MTRLSLGSLALIIFAAGTAGADVVAIEDATVHVRPGETLEGATVVIRDGVIEQVGDAAAPPEARRIDGDGRVVTSGFVDPYSRLGMVEVNDVSETNEGQFSSDLDEAIHAAYRVTDGYNPRSVAIPVARTGGVTSAVAVPQGGIVAGAAAWMSLGAGADARAATVQSPAAMMAALGDGALEAGDGSRGFAAMRLRELLTDAAALADRRDAYERGQSRELAAGRLALEAMEPVAGGEVPLVVTAHRASDVAVALDIAESFDLDLAITGATEAWIHADELADAGVAVILDPLANLPASFERAHARDDAARVLAEAGVPVAFSNAGRASAARTLRQRAGNAVARGMDWDDALAALTTAPAAIYGVDDVGELAPGYRADVAVWSGDPFELGSHLEALFIGGQQQPARTRQTELLERYRDLGH